MSVAANNFLYWYIAWNYELCLCSFVLFHPALKLLRFFINPQTTKSNLAKTTFLFACLYS